MFIILLLESILTALTLLQTDKDNTSCVNTQQLLCIQFLNKQESKDITQLQIPKNIFLQRSFAAKLSMVVQCIFLAQEHMKKYAAEERKTSHVICY
jgi:hypothetical protein